MAQGWVGLLDAGGDAAQTVAVRDELLRLSRSDPDWSWRRSSVPARDWRRLETVQAYAEALGIPINMANETLPSLWHPHPLPGPIQVVSVNLKDAAEALHYPLGMPSARTGSRGDPITL